MRGNNFYERSGEYDHRIWFWAWNMGWNIIRGNHARTPRSGSPKKREFALFVLKIKLFFFLIQVFFRYNKSFIYHPLGRFGKILPSMMINIG